MTIGESIVSWLLEFGDIDIIETDQLDSETGSLGLYKQANSQVTEFVDGSRDVTAYYYLLARQPVRDERSRVANQDWAERLERWVRQKNLSRELPELSDNRICYGAAVNVGAYLSEADEGDRTAEYQISIMIKYTEV